MSHPPEWLTSLADAAASLFSPADILSPIACHYCEIGEVWEVTLFASQTEVLGGPMDGGLRPSRFHVDVKRLGELFDEVDVIYWQAHGFGREDDLGPHLGIEGRCRGHRVWLRVPSLPPKRFPPGRRAVTHDRAWEDLW